MSNPSRVHFEIVSSLQSSVSELFAQEFSFSTGYVATLLSGCLFAPSLLTFWFVNGVIDFSTALTIGAVASPAGLQTRLLAYLLLVPVFFGLRISIHLLHPTHRRQILAGSCPNAKHLSLDWFSVGILATGLPLALQNLGPWVGMNVVFLLGIFVVPRALSTRRAMSVRFASLVAGTLLFLYASYGAAVPYVPDPAAVVGPVATLALSDATVATLFEVVNSLVLGPPLVAVFGVLMNRLLTRPELTNIPLVHHSLPERDPERVVVTSAALGTVFYLGVVSLTTGNPVFVPESVALAGLVG